MTDIVPVPAMPVVPLYPALGSANFNMEAYTYGSSMRGVSQWQHDTGQACYTNALVAHERASVASDAGVTAVAARDVTVAARDVTVAAKDVAVTSSNTASSAAISAAADASTATAQANRAQDIADTLAVGPVASFNGRGGVVTLTSVDVTDALGFQPEAPPAQIYSDSSFDTQELAVNTEYALYTSELYSRPLPSAPEIGDRIVLNNFENTWDKGLFTLVRGNPSHKINNFSDDILFNTNKVRRAELTYIRANYWLLAFS